jgi:hypothetical protein
MYIIASAFVGFSYMNEFALMHSMGYTKLIYQVVPILRIDHLSLSLSSFCRLFSVHLFSNGRSPASCLNSYLDGYREGLLMRVYPAYVLSCQHPHNNRRNQNHWSHMSKH